MGIQPVRLQLSRASTFRLQRASLEANGLPAVKVDRTTQWGNPYRVGEPVDGKQVRRWGWRFNNLDCVCKDRVEAMRRFRYCLFSDEAIHAHVIKHLRGKNLACWCGPESACHADALLELANRAAIERAAGIA